MRQMVMTACAAGCAAVALLAGKSADAEWRGVALSVLFAGMAGALVAAAAG
jgi:multidrug efflux pump subunit AcrB